MTACLLVASLLLSAVGAAAAPAPGASPPAAATNATDASTDAVPALIEEAERQYKQGLLDDALRTLTQAYKLSPLPEILYNIAQVQRKRGDCAAALAAYKKYVDQTGPSDPKHDRAQGRIGEMQVCVDGKDPTAGPPMVAPPKHDLPPAPPPTTTEPPAIVTRTAPPPVAAASDRHRSARLAGWGLIAAGGLCEIAAGLLQWKASGIQSELDRNDMDAPDPNRWNQLNSEGSRDARWALWTAIAGGALGAGGAAILIVNRQSDPATPRATVIGWTGAF